MSLSPTTTTTTTTTTLTTMSGEIDKGTMLFEFLLRDYKFMNAVDRLTLKVLQKEDTNLEVQDVPELVMLLMELLTSSTTQAKLNKADNLILLNHFQNYIIQQLQCASFDETVFTKMFNICTRLAYLKVNYVDQKKDSSNSISNNNKKSKIFSFCFDCFGLKR